ncbi:electron transfer flavoprotein-ubiquinone oxidoreductase [Rhodovibrio sodomensis]|uniref:Electron transfer flavoprotein-ubiquinone oxidoreductase n=1 Tax=Rhodovibrio sodomensis TaxID=1088 RepID=A0ABS1DM39_9PROT|nr:electron transfer flavoprotein-ubiquinone oxidoreductase [Rhodovibrio sodomensis]MBK1671547.1 electron transfer flavoprotein-ubiquinone oxidoreductase [Rhodovibrio sodomensis]
MSEREAMEYDVVIVGAGPSGLSAAIRLRQLAEENGQEISVCVLEKGSEVGAHILSGAVIESRALDELIPDWKDQGAPLNTPVKNEKFLYLTERGGFSVPVGLLPAQMQNHGNYIVSLGNVTRWLGERAEAMGVEIYPGFAASEVLFDDQDRVVGVATNELGIAADGSHKDSYTPSIELRAKYTVFSEGCRGSLSEQLVAKYGLRDSSDPMTYGIGLKELWEVPADQHDEGLVMHTSGWPMDDATWGGSFMYHLENNQVYVGYVIGLDYKNPYLSPFDEFQRFKTHPKVRPYLEGGKRVSYGARALNEGGLQSLPKMQLPGGIITGCAAGTLNVPKIKGSHNAMKTGMLAAESIAAVLAAGDQGQSTLDSYQEKFDASWVKEELHTARNVRPAVAKLGMKLGTLYAGLDLKLFGGKAPWTFHHKHGDHETLKPKEQMREIEYPKPDGVVSFDKLSSVYLANVWHDEDQPSHLQLKDSRMPVEHNLEWYDAPEQRYCPANVYEIVRDSDGSNPRLQINFTNCVHCKTCDIKDPTQNIVWTTPEGGGGPNYPNM